MASQLISFRVHSNLLPFPLDMLRYDGCFPMSQEDVDKISISLDRETSQDERFNLGSIILGHHASSKAWKPTYERWESMGWQVMDVASNR